ncbi:MAG TPA: hypothetical protein VGX37_02625 [Allosphingosinicella sp.]|jgi:hypothetical protein|nr:hypothetical protein [Allosphingosinicella sp.]
MIEEIPKLLKQRLDPVGFALDQLHDKWAKTVSALHEGAASAEQMAQAQQLYKLELEETTARTASASQGLKDFLEGMKIGPSSPYSLRQQEEAATAALRPFLDKINAGEGIDQEKYQATAQTFLDIERQLYGSTGKFFEAQDLVMAATSKAIAKIDSAVPIRTAVDPFVEQTAANTGQANEILSQMNERLAQLGVQLNRLAPAGTGGGGGFIGGGNGFSAVRGR